MQKSLNKQTIIVIGGSSGIGWAVAKICYEQGANVSLSSRVLAKAQAAAQAIGDTVQALELDVDEEEAVNACLANFDQIDHIYIAAGSTKLGGVLDGSLLDNMQAFQTRLLGSLRIVRAAAPKMRPQGSIIFTGGVSTDRPIAGAWVSGLATASAEQLARVLVMEFPQIRFNAIAPGYTDTPMWDTIFGADKTAVLATVAEKLPSQKIASPEEVASAVLLLMSNHSITGEVIHVDGGGRLV